MTAELPPDRGHGADTAGLAGLIGAKLGRSGLDEAARTILLEALDGEQPLDAGTVPRAYLQSVTVGRFRGIGRTTRLQLTPALRSGVPRALRRTGPGGRGVERGEAHLRRRRGWTDHLVQQRSP